jgi:hypothetical protein
MYLHAMTSLPICRDRWQLLLAPFPNDRFILLFSPGAPDFDGNMEVGKFKDGRFYTEDGFELSPESSYSHHGNAFTHWRDVPLDWQPFTTVPANRYVLLTSAPDPEWMEVAIRYGDEEDDCFWSCGGANGGTDDITPPSGNRGTNRGITHWQELPEAPEEPPTEEFPEHEWWRGMPRRQTGAASRG